MLLSRSLRCLACSLLVVWMFASVSFHAMAQEPAGAEPLSVEALARLLEDAEQNWLYGDPGAVYDILYDLLVPSPEVNLTDEQTVQAYMLLGAAQLPLRQAPQAAESFHRMLRIDPDYEPDPFLYPNSVINTVDEVREEYAAELDVIRESLREADHQTPGGYIEARVEYRPLLISVLPFGIGQFTNDQPEWGTLYLVTELGFGATSMLMFALNEGARDDDGFFPDVEAAERRQTIQLASFTGFLLLVVTNMIHGAVIHEDIGEITYTVRDSPPDELLRQSPEPESRLAPHLGWDLEGGFSLGFSAQF